MSPSAGYEENLAFVLVKLEAERGQIWSDRLIAECVHRRDILWTVEWKPGSLRCNHQLAILIW